MQQAVKMILEPIWETDFVDESIGYRPGRSARQATYDLTAALDSGTYRWVMEWGVENWHFLMLSILNVLAIGNRSSATD